jgi:apolipoprotein N-acyltransferase
MNQAAAARVREQNRIWKFIRTSIPSLPEISLIIGSALLTVLSFPNFDLWFLAWIGLVPLLFVVARSITSHHAFVAGWLWGTIFFYGTCWWLTYPMIHFGHISPWFAYPLFLLPVIFVGLFPAAACSLTARVINQFGSWAIIIAPLIWVSFEWLRYAVTGQLWNALGYSQAFHPLLIQSARIGGVYIVGFIILAINASITFVLVRKGLLAMVVALAVLVGTAALIATAGFQRRAEHRNESAPRQIVIAIQPNVPMDLSGDTEQMNKLLERHLSLSLAALNDLKAHPEFGASANTLPRFVIWPESPMNFSYSRDPHLREVIGNFARTNHASVLLNSLEAAANGGDQNSAVMINEQGEIVARYDKIRLMPFGEYVPLPRWLPGASSVRSIVGEFKPGSSYTLMPLGALRAGVFICIEAAHPGIARNFTNEGADVLINISNDGYLGPTPVMRQHLSNAIFRAVENDRGLIRVTNTGITAYISANGTVSDQTGGFQEAVRTWTITKSGAGSTFYSRHGDVFVYGCALISLGFISASFMRRRVLEARP